MCRIPCESRPTERILCWVDSLRYSVLGLGIKRFIIFFFFFFFFVHKNNYTILLLVNSNISVVAQPVSDRQAYSRGAVQAYQATSASKRSKRKTRGDVVSDDKRRDYRNLERRKIIKQQTSQRRGSLVDSISIAKSIIDGQSKNKQFEEKASERRRVIKQSMSGYGERPRSMSFFEELQTGCSVILPSEDYQNSVKRSKDRCRTIKDRSSSKMRKHWQRRLKMLRK